MPVRSATSSRSGHRSCSARRTPTRSCRRSTGALRPSMDEKSVELTFNPAAYAALAGFPIEPAELTLVSMSENVTYRVTDARDGSAYVLRLHRPGYHSLHELECERTWIRALAEAGIGVPAPIRARNGAE